MLSRATLRASWVALAVGGLALAALSVAGANPACGSTVTHSVTLTADMTCTTSDAIDVGKSGITINLNGHTITGPSGTYSIENGTVQNFKDGVHVDDSSDSKILKVKAHGASEAGIAYWYSLDGVIDHSGASDNGLYGIYLYENTNVNVTNTPATHNSGYGVYDYYSVATLNHVTANTNGSEGFYVDAPAAYSGPGAYMTENSTANNNGNIGVEIYDDLPQWQYQADLIANTANDNTNYGFYGEYLVKGSHNHATGNGTQNC